MVHRYAAAIVALVLWVGVGSLPGTQTEPAVLPKFDVASVRLYKDDGVGPRNSRSTYGPQGVTFGARTLAFLIGEAYSFPVGRIVPSGFERKGPQWEILAQGYDVVAKADRAVSREQIRLMLQSLLADRFRLTLRRESKTGPVYRLVVAKGGAKLKESATAGDLVMAGSADGYVFRNAEVFRLAGYLSSVTDRLVVDDTGLRGLYDFTIRKPEELPAKSERSPETPSAAAFAEALKPLGLQLVAAAAPVEYLVVERVERPSEN